MSFSKSQKNHAQAKLEIIFQTLFGNHGMIFSIFLSLAIFAGFGNNANAYPIFAQQKCDLKLI